MKEERMQIGWNVRAILTEYFEDVDPFPEGFIDEFVEMARKGEVEIQLKEGKWGIYVVFDFPASLWEKHFKK